MPPAAVAAALSSALIHASWNAALKGGPNADRVVDTFLIAVGGVAMWAVLWGMFGAPPAASWPYLALTVCVHLFYWFALFKGYDAGDLSHVYTLSRGSAPVLVALGAFLFAHETPPPVKAAGIGLVSVGILCVGVSPRAPLRATFWALVIGCCIGSYSLIDALGARITGSAVVYLAWATGLMSIVMIVFALWRRGPVRMVAQASVSPWRGILIGVVSFAGYGLVLWAQTFAPIAQTTALRETSVVFGALIAFLFLRERLGARRWLGAAIVAAGAALIAFA
ncbi:EamA family transporter [Terricaulis sp.]|uniref:EamA family transporter n=1 Tax=Terricaulis sp. TaxID=2768686 RepID=UPI003785312B